MSIPFKAFDEYSDGGATVAADKYIIQRTSGSEDYVSIASSDISTYVNANIAGASAGIPWTEGVKFIEDGSGTSYTATVEVPAATLVLDIGFVTTVLWDGTSASLGVGDDDDADGWFTTVDLKATDLLVGEVLSAADEGGAAPWGGVQGAYLTAAAGRRGRVTAGVDSGWYYGAASEVIFVVTPGAADGSAGRSFGWVTMVTPTFTASTNV